MSDLLAPKFHYREPVLHSGDKSYVYTGGEPPSTAGNVKKNNVLCIYTGGEPRSTDENVKQYVGASTSLGPSSPKRVNELDQMVSKSLIFISECCFYNHHVVPHITGMINP